MRTCKIGYILVKILDLPKILRRFFYVRYYRFIFYLNGVDYGNNMNIHNRFYLRKNRNSLIKIGDNFSFTSGEAFNPLSRNLRGCIYTANSTSKIIIGNNTGISSSCLWAKDMIVIGNNVKIGSDCIIMDNDAHSLNFKIRSGIITDEKGNNIDAESSISNKINIEDDVLIGTRCIILKGVTIGARSIIGAGSVVSKSIPNDCIAVGNPCRVIKKLDKEY